MKQQRQSKVGGDEDRNGRALLRFNMEQSEPMSGRPLSRVQGNSYIDTSQSMQKPPGVSSFCCFLPFGFRRPGHRSAFILNAKTASRNTLLQDTKENIKMKLSRNKSRSKHSKKSSLQIQHITSSLDRWDTDNYLIQSLQKSQHFQDEMTPHGAQMLSRSDVEYDPDHEHEEVGFFAQEFQISRSYPARSTQKRISEWHSIEYVTDEAEELAKDSLTRIRRKALNA